MFHCRFLPQELRASVERLRLAVPYAHVERESDARFVTAGATPQVAIGGLLTRLSGENRNAT
jgi:hypothetical protein